MPLLRKPPVRFFAPRSFAPGVAAVRGQRVVLIGPP